MSKIKAVFLDRDGIINIDKSYIYKIEDFEFTKNIFDVLNYLQDRGYFLFIITNQSGISRGFYTKKDFEKLTKWMLDEFKLNNIEIKQVEYCPHRKEDNCFCRKPQIGMIKNILINFDIDLSLSWLVGDKYSDMECAINAGIENRILLNSKLQNIDKRNTKYLINDLNQIREIIC